MLAMDVQSYGAKIKQLEEDLLFRLSNSQVFLSFGGRAVP